MKILGFDIGITSIGWAFIENKEIKDCGVRIFTKAENPKDGKSLATPRREARSVRRRLARRKGRLESIKKILAQEFGLHYEDYISSDGELPKAFEGKLANPYVLRYEALHRILSKEELARVILHIAKHRGYGNKNIKNTNDDKKKEQGEINKALKANSNKIKQYQSVGEYFYKEFCKILDNDKVRVIKPIRNKNGTYNNCVRQEDLKRELELIFNKQREFGFKITQDFVNKILDQAFYQRPLKDFSHLVGKCSFFPDEYRAPKFSLSAVEFITISKAINLLINMSKETGEYYPRDKIKQILDNLTQEVFKNGNLKFTQVRKILKIDEKILFKELDYTAEKPEDKKFIEFKNLKKFYKILEDKINDRELADFVAKDITLIKDENKLKEMLRKNEKLKDFSNEQIQNLASIDFSHHISLSLKALYEILPFMREGMRYDEACKKAGLKIKHNEKKSKFLLPFSESMYVDDLTNPVVARAISEYRKVLNALIKKYGKMHKIHIELTREIGKSHEERERYKKDRESNYQKRQQAIQECEKLGIKANKANILKLQLFREQGEYCAYSGKKIEISHLQDITALEIDHILPYSRSYDDSYNNKVLVFTAENQRKKNQTPYEAFSKDSEKWEKIKSFVKQKSYPKQKAKKIVEQNFKDREKGFIARNLIDSSYIAKLISNYTKEYLDFLPLDSNEDTSIIAGTKGSKLHIEAVSGALTSVMRHFWGLPIKNRNEHTHHAIDAIIIAYVNQAIIQQFSNFKKNQEVLKSDLLAKKLAKEDFKKQRIFFEPFSGFREKVIKKVDEIFVSCPPRKRARGALHKETFYSINDKKLIKDYGGEEGMQKAIELGKIRKIGTKIVANGAMVRVDIFRHKLSKKFYAVPIYTMDFALGILPNKAVVSGKDKSGVIKDWLEMDSDYEFCFSLFKDDLIKVQKKDMKEPEFAYYVSFGVATASITLAKHDNKSENLTENQSKLFSNTTDKNVRADNLGIQNFKIFEKYKVSPLGDIKPAPYEPRQPISLKTTPKKHKNKYHNKAQYGL